MTFAHIKKNYFVFGSAADVGLNFQADTHDAAILFQQANHEQAIKWRYGERVKGKPPAEAELSVSRDNGDFQFKGGALRVDGPVVTTGLSADKKPSRNLRGKNVAVKSGGTRVEVTFPTAEEDGDYAVFVEQNWLTVRAITRQDAKGFTVAFATPAPKEAKIHWMIVR